MSGSSPRFTPVKKGTMDDRQFLNTSSGLGRRLIRLRDKDCPASKEFLYMGREVNSFHATYQILRPHIHSSSHLINRDGQALVERIYDGIGINCNSIELKVRSFEQRLRNGPRRSQKSALKAWLGGHSNEQDKAYRRFFESNAFTLERCQIRCADLLLKVVLAVLVYAQNIHNVEAIANFPDESHHLIEGLEMAWGNLREIELRALQSEATEARPVRVQARGWWEGLPFQPLGTEATILERLTWLWVNHEARLAARPNPAQEDFMAQIRYWRDHYNAEAELSRGLAQERHELRIQTQQLAADNEVLTRENAGFQGIIDELNEDILQLRRTLEEERNARRNEVGVLRARLDNVNAHPQARDPVHRRSEREYQSRRSSHPGQEHPRAAAEGRSSSRVHRPPPTAFETQGHNRHRSSSSSSNGTRRSSGSSNFWNDGANASDNYSTAASSAPPPIPSGTKPFRTRTEDDSRHRYSRQRRRRHD